MEQPGIVIDGTNLVEFLDPGSPDANDPTNPLAAYGIKAIDPGGRLSSEVFRGFVPGARVVKALNHLDVNVLAQPDVSGGQRVQFYAGDDADKLAVRKSARSHRLPPGGPGLVGHGRPLVGTAVWCFVGDELHQDLNGPRARQSPFKPSFTPEFERFQRELDLIASSWRASAQRARARAAPQAAGID